jgi:outer membrane protein OmpA-like peptidoglycan-associated protein/tetratricopeptide (TPR) repeat protein
MLLVARQATAQNNLSTKNKKAIEYYIQADNFRVRGEHQEAIDLLNMAIQKDKDFFEAHYRLGLVYMGKRNFPEAIKNLEAGLKLTNDPNKQKIFWYDLGDCYFNSGNYDEAFKLFSQYLNTEISNKQKIVHARQVLANIEFAKQNSTKASKYKLKPLSDTVNTFMLQYFPVLTADQQELIFTRRLGNDMNKDFEDIVVSRKNEKGQWTKPISISKHINTPFNEGTCTISADGRKLIFTSCMGRDGFGSCDLFESFKVGNEWSEPVNLGAQVNTTEWESQPSLSADGRTLYFVSDRRGGYGRRDIWVSFQSEKGEWTKAKNAGKEINTVYDEISPFIHVNNRVLYFASNGLTGMGGNDIYYSEKDSINNWTKPVNLGVPINNHEDQFSLFITADGKKGYYSHEETATSGQSTSKIYEIEIPEENQVKYRSNYVKGTIRDKETRAPLSAKVELINIETNERESLVTSDSITGSYLIVLTQGAEYALYVNRQGYLFKSQNFDYADVKDFQPIIQDVDLEKLHSGSIAVLNNIFFDTDKYALKEKSKTELLRVVQFLNENPQIKIEVSGHTDNVGGLMYNQQLSEKRANAVYDYLISNGIDQKRLMSRGYGQSDPIAPNDSEQNRQLNRRIQFRLIP